MFLLRTSRADALPGGEGGGLQGDRVVDRLRDEQRAVGIVRRRLQLLPGPGEGRGEQEELPDQDVHLLPQEVPALLGHPDLGLLLHQLHPGRVDLLHVHPPGASPASPAGRRWYFGMKSTLIRFSSSSGSMARRSQAMASVLSKLRSSSPCVMNFFSKASANFRYSRPGRSGPPRRRWRPAAAGRGRRRRRRRAGRPRSGGPPGSCPARSPGS